MKLLIQENTELASQWNFEKNKEVDINSVSVTSRQKVWWIGDCGHEWMATVESRNRGRGCPYCSGKKTLRGFNDFGTIRPDLLQEWDYDGNVGLSPYDFTAGSHKEVIWKCKNCNKTWSAIIKSRVNGNGCPYCAIGKRKNTFNKTVLYTRNNSVKERAPELVEEWIYDEDTGYTPENTSIGSHRLIRWKCKKCGYIWAAVVKNRINGSGCPSCSGMLVKRGINDLKTICPDLAEEWNYEKNLDISPERIHTKSGRVVWWKCRLGHEWECRVADRVDKNTGCPTCNKRFKTSFPEQAIYYYILKYFPRAVNSYKPIFLKPSEIDIYIPELKVGIEYDGQKYHKSIDKDKKKDSVCINNDITLIRIREPKCVFYERIHPTFYLDDLSFDSLSKMINSILLLLSVDEIDVNVERDRYIITKSFYRYAVDNSLEKLYPQLAAEWDTESNDGLLPNNIPANKSKIKYNWICQKCGYKWSAVLAERIAGTGCPVCTNRVIVIGINDLATTNPELEKEWDYDKNFPLKPQDFTIGSHENVWWICSKCGYNWHTRINRRVNGSGCNNCFVNSRKKKVYQFNIDGELISIYDSAKAASEITGFSVGAISKACRSVKHQSCGFLWYYKLPEDSD